MIMAAIGAALLVIDKIKGKEPVFSRDFLILSMICAAISVWSLLVTLLNDTADYTFARYIVSVWVWLGAAYTIVRLIQAVHKDVSVELIGHYLIAVCTVQCLLAYAMTMWPAVGEFVDGMMGEGESFMSATENRMHGLGAALDPAGLRFSAVLVILAFLMGRLDFDEHPWKGILYLLSFTVILVAGNMIARTTTVGGIIAIFLYIILKWPKNQTLVFGRAWTIVGGGIFLLTIITVWLYRVDPAFRENLRFGFEGFFSLVEKGRWEVRSNNILKGMVVWPESLKTWVIGDGFFDSPEDLPDQFGQVFGGFYMKTDIGYLRYIFYFGVIGLMGILLAFCQMTAVCVRSSKEYVLLFVAFLVINLIGWFKVSSDIIMVYAPFLILAFMKTDELCTSSTT